jgi:hypothetical protein
MSLKSPEKKASFTFFPNVEASHVGEKAKRSSETTKGKTTGMVKYFYFAFALAPPDKCISPSNSFAFLRPSNNDLDHA